MTCWRRFTVVPSASPDGRGQFGVLVAESIKFAFGDSHPLSVIERYVESHGTNDFVAKRRFSDMHSWHFADTVHSPTVRHPKLPLGVFPKHAFFRRPGPTPGPSFACGVTRGSSIAIRVADLRYLLHFPGCLGKSAASVEWDRCWLTASVGGADLGTAPPFYFRSVGLVSAHGAGARSPRMRPS